MTKKLELAPHLALPPDAATQVYAFMGKRGSGKTYAAGKLTELLLGAGVQTIVMDPVGNWWGLRLAADGKHPGFEIPVLGGEHGDIPLAVDAGELVADMLVDTGSSAILDVSPMSKSARKKFIADFAEHFFQRKKTSRSAVHIVLEEAHLVLPQHAHKGEERMLGALEDLVRLGRNYGIGVSMLDQRPQSVSKEALNQAEVLLAFQLIGAHERDAIKKWVDYHGVGSDLATLNVQKPGEAIAWAPWLEKPGVYRVHEKETFDSSATPKAGEAARDRKLKPLDLKALEASMSAVVEEAKANDPKLLHKRIAELEKQLAAKPSGKTAKATKKEFVPLVTPKNLAAFQKGLTRMEAGNAKLGAAVDLLDKERDRLAQAQQALVSEADNLRTFERNVLLKIIEQQPPILSPQTGRQAGPRAVPQESRPAATSKPAGSERRSRGVTAGETALPVGEAATLRALIQFPDGLRREQLTVLTAYKRSTRDAYVARLREKGFVDARGDLVVATQEGFDAMPGAEPLPTGEALREFWDRELPAGERQVLALLCEHYPNAIERGAIDEPTGFKRSTRDAYLSRLAAKQLVVEAGRGLVQASPNLFEVVS